MKISVIIPTYKPKNYLWDCLNSLNHQSLSNNEFEILLVLNGPQETYYDMISDYIKINLVRLNVQFLQTEISGVSHARNIGIENAKAEFITFLDDDDYVSESYLEDLYKVSSANTVGVAKMVAFTEGVNTSQPYRITDEFLNKSKYGRLPFYKVRKTFSGPCGKMFYRDVIGDRRFDLHFKNGEDSLFMFLISDRLKYVSFTNENAIYYRRYRANSAVTMVRNRNEIVQNSFNLIYSYIRIWINKPLKYNLFFFLTRVLGAIRMAFR